MTRSKKIFIGFAVAFFILLVITVYDISRRTTFPGSKAKQKDSIEVKSDSVKGTLSPNSAVHQP